MQQWKIFLVAIYLVSTATGCAPISISETPSVPSMEVKETSTPTIILSPTIVVQNMPASSTPSVLFEGSITFQTTLGSDDNLNAVYDFDSNTTVSPDELRENDIRFDVSQGTNTFVTATPINDAAGFPLEKSHADVFKASDCDLSVSKFKSGGRPIHPNQFFCLKTNKGNLVEYVINDIDKMDNIFYIEIRYTVWSVSK
jgi:hypothetical protein